MSNLRDFHVDREAWIEQYSTGKHLETRLAQLVSVAWFGVAILSVKTGRASDRSTL